MTTIATHPPRPAAAAAAPKPAAPAPSPVEMQIAERMTSAGIMEHATVLAAKPRVAGSPDYKAAAAYVVDQAKAQGWDARIIEHAGSGFGGTLYNVIAERKGTAPDAERKLVIAGAHLDSVNRAPGANDNASGSGTLLEMTEVFSKVPTPNDLRFLWFDGEEAGLLGSRAYVRDRAGDLDRAVVMLNMDMVGSPNGDVGYSMAVGTSTGVGQAISGVAARNGLTAAFRPERHNRSDHGSFDRAGIPAADFGVSVRTIDKDDPNYHSSRDTIDKLNPKVLEGYGDLIALTVNDFASQTKRITEPKPPRPLKPTPGDDGPPI